MVDYHSKSLMALAKERWQETGSPEEVLGWAAMASVVQFASLAFEKRGEWLNGFTKKDKAGLRLKGRNWPFPSSTYYDFPLFHLLECEMGIHFNGLVDFRHVLWWTPVFDESRLQWWTRAVDFCRLEWHKG